MQICCCCFFLLVFEAFIIIKKTEVMLVEKRNQQQLLWLLSPFLWDKFCSLTLIWMKPLNSPTCCILPRGWGLNSELIAGEAIQNMCFWCSFHSTSSSTLQWRSLFQGCTRHHSDQQCPRLSSGCSHLLVSVLHNDTTFYQFASASFRKQIRRK